MARADRTVPTRFCSMLHHELALPPGCSLPSLHDPWRPERCSRCVSCIAGQQGRQALLP